MRWMIYGANGYTGQKIAKEAARRGMGPVLAGRSVEALERVAGPLGLEVRCFTLDDLQTVGDNLRDMDAVANCAGPFEATAEPIVDACLAAKCHYVDITGEFHVMDAITRRHQAARDSGVVLCPGCGFDVIPTDCLVARLKAALPDATDCALALNSDMGVSPGSAKSALGLFSRGTFVRKNGRLEQVARRRYVRPVIFNGKTRLFGAVSWGDLVSSYYTTGIPNIEVYLVLRGGKLEAWLEPLIRTLLRSALIRRGLSRVIDRKVVPPGEQELRNCGVDLWAEVTNARGECRTATMSAPNGYALTVQGAIAAIERLARYQGEGGYKTPVQLMEVDIAERVLGCSQITIA